MRLGKILAGAAALTLMAIAPAVDAKDRISAAQGQRVSVPFFSDLYVGDGGVVTVSQSSTYSVTVDEGASRVELFTDSGTLEVGCRRPCRSNVRRVINVTAPRISSVSVRGGGSVTFGSGFGSQTSLEVDVTRGGTIDAFNVSASNVNATVTGGGTIRVTATEALEASVIGSGQIIYDGDPAVSYGKIAGGTISPR